ncbi:MAG: alpha/beta fold hydrolase [Pigmentiphaga sp.]|uniref:alpha/beta fold hydrolase n=1 Tax=unclassified Pigmentiphaga TaxID=2626614 RepID=UPI000B4125D2|nr:alpha/beta fold hydrolase [Pigmentiphaga sp. NML030171]OVZ66515.1 hypothetical protein CDO46_00260 [Pigmentiphaga sp. NML030171]
MTSSGLSWQLAGAADGPAVVLLHPIATNRSLWDPLLPVWARHFRLICVDLPGHGHSPLRQNWRLDDAVHDLARILDQAGAASAAIVGTSLGGMVAQAFALAYPARCSALVLAHCGAYTAPSVARVWEQRLAALRTDGFDAHVEATLGRWFTRDFLLGSPLTADWLRALMHRTPIQGYVDAVGAIQRLDHRERLRELARPTLVVAGRNDSAIPPEIAAELAGAIRGATLELCDAAHMACVEQPTWFTETVGRFVLRHGR